MEGMKAAAGGVVGDLARARIALDERGERLGELEERTALLMTSAEFFSKNAHTVRTPTHQNYMEEPGVPQNQNSSLSTAAC